MKKDIQEMIVEEEKDMIELENPQVYQAVKDIIEILPLIGVHSKDENKNFN